MAIRYIDEAPATKSMIRYLDEEPVKTVVPEVMPKGSPAYGGMQGLKRLAVGGVTGFGTAKGSEDVLPMAGQVMGGANPVTASGGAALGELARQGIKVVRGDASGIKDPMKLASGPVGMSQAIPSVGREAGGTLAIEGAFRGLGKAARPLANRMMNSVIKTPTKVLKRNPNFGVEALEAGITGTRKGMLEKSGKLIESGEDALSSVLKNSQGNVDAVSVASQLDELKRPFMNVGDQASVDAIEQVQKSIASKGTLSLEQANQLKRDLYKVVKESSYGKGVGEITSKQSAMKQAARGLKEGIEQSAPQVKDINKRIALGVDAQKALEQEMALGGRRVILPKLAGMGAGGLAMTGNIPGALGVLAGDQTVSFLRSPLMMTGAAKNLMKIRKLARPLASLSAETLRRSYS